MPQEHTFKPGELVYVHIIKSGYWTGRKSAKFIRYTPTGRITVLLYNYAKGKEVMTTFNAESVEAKGVAP